MLCGTALRDVECAFVPPQDQDLVPNLPSDCISKNTLGVVPLVRPLFGSTMDLE